MKHKADLILRLEGKSSAMADSLKKLDIKYVLLIYNIFFWLFSLAQQKDFELLMFLLLFSPKYTMYTSAVATEDLVYDSTVFSILLHIVCYHISTS